MNDESCNMSVSIQPFMTPGFHHSLSKKKNIFFWSFSRQTNLNQKDKFIRSYVFIYDRDVMEQ
ncbi:MAG: hypothetical protein Sylvanvirus4_20 [Sylvanvirus sp.]|uniref:Uncharacterized protein n=1 Tax=Sylvanvirus sp. TaxID=2487774 RepID=A0A3G5AHI1_9VIRU|nr:MAG: hypothetical protein Sylvanvirus4_20 [Sylvanvirus sp.]